MLQLCGFDVQQAHVSKLWVKLCAFCLTDQPKVGAATGAKLGPYGSHRGAIGTTSVVWTFLCILHFYLYSALSFVFCTVICNLDLYLYSEFLFVFWTFICILDLYLYSGFPCVS